MHSYTSANPNKNVLSLDKQDSYDIQTTNRQNGNNVLDVFNYKKVSENVAERGDAHKCYPKITGNNSKIRNQNLGRALCDFNFLQLTQVLF